MIDYFDSKSIYFLISLSNFTDNKEASQSANSPELKFSLGNAGNDSVISPFQIQEFNLKRGSCMFDTQLRKSFFPALACLSPLMYVKKVPVVCGHERKLCQYRCNQANCIDALIIVIRPKLFK